MHDIKSSHSATALVSDVPVEGSLDVFVREIHREIEAFAASYRAQHAENPDDFPLALNEDNHGLWFEFFIDHCTKGSP